MRTNQNDKFTNNKLLKLLKLRMKNYSNFECLKVKNYTKFQITPNFCESEK